MLIFSTPREKLWVGSNDGWRWAELPTYYHDSDGDDDPKIMMKMMITNWSTGPALVACQGWAKTAAQVWAAPSFGSTEYSFFLSFTQTEK